MFGIDGTRLNLPCTKELTEIYGAQTSQGAPQVQALVSCVYNLLHGIIVDTCFAPCLSSERDAAMAMMADFHVKKVKDPVFIMDCGYPSAELLNELVTNGHKFIIRYSSEFVQNEEIVNDDVTIDHTFKMKKLSMKLCVLKIKLSDQETEYLVTNIFNSNITLEDFKWAYRKRWGDRNKVQRREKQAGNREFFGLLAKSNLAGFLCHDVSGKSRRGHAI